MIIDVEESKIISTLTGRLMHMNFNDMTYQDFDNKRLTQPFMIDSSGQLLFWYKRVNMPAKWYKINDLYTPDIIEAIKILTQNKIESELLS
jgi:hypothetical protein